MRTNVSNENDNYYLKCFMKGFLKGFVVTSIGILISRKTAHRY